jgi:hypothetical protein
MGLIFRGKLGSPRICRPCTRYGNEGDCLWHIRKMASSDDSGACPKGFACSHSTAETKCTKTTTSFCCSIFNSVSMDRVRTHSHLAKWSHLGLLDLMLLPHLSSTNLALTARLASAFLSLRRSAFPSSSLYVVEQDLRNNRSIGQTIGSRNGDFNVCTS